MANARGIPCRYTEVSGGSAASATAVRLYVEGVQRVLAALRMLPMAARATPVSVLFRSFVAVGGVAAAQRLGQIVGYDERVLDQIAATVGGIVAMAWHIPRVAEGEGLYLPTQQAAD